MKTRGTGRNVDVFCCFLVFILMFFVQSMPVSDQCFSGLHKNVSCLTVTASPVMETICLYRLPSQFSRQDIITVLLPSASVLDLRRSPYLGVNILGLNTGQALLCCDLVSILLGYILEENRLIEGADMGQW